MTKSGPERLGNKVERVALAALIDKSQVLLVHRHPERRFYPDCWDLVGGHIEAGESPIEAVRRECKEEVGIQVVEARPFHLPTSDPGIEIHGFRVDSWAGEPTNAAPDEHDDLKWFTADEIPLLTIADPASIAAIVSLLAERGCKTDP